MDYEWMWHELRQQLERREAETPEEIGRNLSTYFLRLMDQIEKRA